LILEALRRAVDIRDRNAEQIAEREAGHAGGRAQCAREVRRRRPGPTLRTPLSATTASPGECAISAGGRSDQGGPLLGVLRSPSVARRVARFAGEVVRYLVWLVGAAVGGLLALALIAFVCWLTIDIATAGHP